MSESYGGGSAGISGTGSQQPSGTVETARQEAMEVKDTATEEAGHVVETAKSEAAAVAHEAKNQARDLYAQTTQELREQASHQQTRVAEGLRSVGGELRAMADNSEDGGIAADLVRQASTKVSAVAGWIGDRDPGSLLSEVKSYARRKPGVFIGVAALAGLAVGRLTRAMAEGAREDHDAQGGSAGVSRSAPTQADVAGRPGGASPAAGTVPRSGTVPPVGATPAAGVVPPAVPPGGSDAPGTAPVTGMSGTAGAAGAMAAPLGGGVPRGEGGEFPGSAGAEDTPVFDQTDAAARDANREERP